MSRKKVVILGGGMIGSAMAMDLKRTGRHEVTVAEVKAEVRERIAARYGVATVAADLSSPAAIRELVAGYDFVLGRAPQRAGAPDPAGGDRGREGLLRHQLHARERPRARRPRAGTGRLRGGGLRRGPRRLEHDGRLRRRAALALREPGDLRGRPAQGAALALRLQGGLRPLRRDRGVHPSRADRGPRPRRGEGGVVRAGAHGLSRGGHPRGLQHRRPPEPRPHPGRALHEGEDAPLPGAHRPHGCVSRDRPLLQGAAARGRGQRAAPRRHGQAPVPEVDLRGGGGRPHGAARDRRGHPGRHGPRATPGTSWIASTPRRACAACRAPPPSRPRSWRA